MPPDADTRIDPPKRLLAEVSALLRQLHGDRQPAQSLRLDTTFDQLGLDSLTRLELISRIENVFGVVIPEAVFVSLETPRDLLREVNLAAERGGATAAAADAEAKDTTEYSAKNEAARPDFPGERLRQKSELPKLPELPELPENTRTLVEVLAWHAERHPDLPHIRLYDDAGAGEIITVLDLQHGARRVAAGLIAAGLEPRQAVLVMLPTGREYFFSFFGVLLAGGVPVPVYPPGQLRHIEEHLLRHAAIAENCQATLMIAMPEALPFARLLGSRAPRLNRVIGFDDLVAGQEHQAVALPVVAAADIAFLQYTSGSTGAPKGVVLSHANLLANIRAMGRAVKVTPDDVFVSWLPLYHDMGLIGAWLGSLYHGCRLVLMSPLAFLARPERWFKAISRFRGTFSAAPNFAYELATRRIDDAALAGLDLSSWRCAFNGAEAVSARTIERFSERFAACGFNPRAMMPVYGLAESSVGLAFPPLGRGPRIDRIDRRALTAEGAARPVEQEDVDCVRCVGCGMALAGHEIRIVDEAGRELPDRCQGRVQFKGPSATSGYFRNSPATAALFVGEWLDSGDYGYLADNELFVTTRRKDMIIRAGRNIYPEEIEEAVGGISGVRPGCVAVFGCGDTASGTERLVVLAETRKREAAARLQVEQEIRERVAGLAGGPPDEIVLAPPATVPKTSSGKIRRAACRDLYEKELIGGTGRAVWWQVARFVASGWASGLYRARAALLAWGWAAWAWTVFGLASLCSLPVLFLLPGDRRRWAFLRRLCSGAFSLAGIGFRLTGENNLPRVGRACVLVANHASYLDSMVLAACLGRPVHFVAKAELRRHRGIRLLLDRLGTVYVERFDRQKSIDDARHLVRVAASGRTLVFFPEGTCLRQTGLLPFHLGAFDTAVAAHLPVVPVVIRGTRSILRPDSWFPRRGRVVVEFGAALVSREEGASPADNRWQRAIGLRDAARGWILARCGEPDLGERMR